MATLSVLASVGVLKSCASGESSLRGASQLLPASTSASGVLLCCRVQANSRVGRQYSALPQISAPRATAFAWSCCSAAQRPGDHSPWHCRIHHACSVMASRSWHFRTCRAALSSSRDTVNNEAHTLPRLVHACRLAQRIVRFLLFTHVLLVSLSCCHLDCYESTNGAATLGLGAHGRAAVARAHSALTAFQSAGSLVDASTLSLSCCRLSDRPVYGR